MTNENNRHKSRFSIALIFVGIFTLLTGSFSFAETTTAGNKDSKSVKKESTATPVKKARKPATKKKKAKKRKRRKSRRKRAKRRKYNDVRRSYIGTKQLNSFINYAVRKHKFKRKELLTIFANIKSRPDIIRLMGRQAESLPWYKYKKIFLQKKRINNGVKFWKRNAKILAAAQKKYGVPPEIIVAIVGVETLYGKRTGNIHILESLASLSFDYPRRAKFFRREMMHFLLLAREEKFKAAKLQGSFAGAMGMPQFMPSSYRAYAVDFNKDGKRDLFRSRHDVIGSVANYFATFGWKKGRPVITRARIKGSAYRRMPKPRSRLKPHLTLKQYAKYGVTPRSKSRAYKSSHKASFVRLAIGKRKNEYWLGMGNFYTITRYNHSNHYAMAVYLLSQKIKKKYYRAKRKSVRYSKKN